VRRDGLSDYFSHKLLSNDIVDMVLVKLKPTWSNRRVGVDQITKCIDHFLLYELTIHYFPLIHQWVGFRGIS